MPAIRHSINLVVLLAALATPLVAQEKPKPVERLDALLQELRSLDADVWAARLDTLKKEADKHRGAAAQLRLEAAALEAKAKALDGKATSVDQQIAHERELMTLIGPAPAKVAATKVKAAPADKPKPAPANEPKAVPAKEVPKPAPANDKPKPVTTTDAPETAAVKSLPPNFEDHILPILEQHCIGCHSRDDQSGGLDVSSFDALLQGGSSGAVVKKGDAEGSRLWRLVSHTEQPTMPPDQSMIPKEQVDAIRDWIGGGAHPKASAAAQAEMAPEAAPSDGEPPPSSPQAAHEPPLPADGVLQPVVTTPRPPVVKALATSPTAPLLAIPGDGNVILARTDPFTLLGALPFPLGQVEALRFSLDGEHLLVGGGVAGRRGGAALYDVREGTLLAQYGREFDTVLAVALSPRETLVAIAGPSGKVRVFDAKTAELRFEILEHEDWILALDISPDGNYIASGDRAGRLVISEADTGLNVHTISAHNGPVHAISFRPDAGRLATGGEDGNLRLWEMEDGNSTVSNRAGQGGLLALGWSSEQRLATAGTQGPLKLWNAEGRPDGNLPGLPDWTFGLAFAADGSQLFAGCWDGQIRVVDLKTRRLVDITVHP